MASRSEAKSKDLKKFNIHLIHGILRHFVPQNDSALFVGRDFVYTLAAASSGCQTVDKLMRQSIDTHGGIVKGGW